MCGGLIDDEVIVIGFCPVGKDASPDIGCFAQCSSVRFKYNTPSDAGIPEICTS